LEARANQYKEVLPLCEQIFRLRIGIDELLAFHTAVCEKAEMYKLSKDRAAYRLIEDIRDSDKLGGMKKQLNDISIQIFMMNQFLGRRNKAITSLLNMQCYGIGDDEIVRINEFLNSIRFNSAAKIQI
jgi:hypothetical protein